MTAQEFSTLVKGMKAVYSDPKFIADNYAMEVWFSMLKDLSYEHVNAAIQRHMMINSFPPTIADIRKGVNVVTSGYQQSSNEVWQVVDKIVRSLPIGQDNVHQVAEIAFNGLPSPARRLLGGPARLIEMATEYSLKDYEVARMSFVRDYYGEDAQKKEQDALSPQMIALMDRFYEARAIPSKSSPKAIETKQAVRTRNYAPMSSENAEKLEDLKRKFGA